MSECIYTGRYCTVNTVPNSTVLYTYHGHIVSRDKHAVTWSIHYYFAVLFLRLLLTPRRHQSLHCRERNAMMQMAWLVQDGRKTDIISSMSCMIWFTKIAFRGVQHSTMNCWMCFSSANVLSRPTPNVQIYVNGKQFHATIWEASTHHATVICMMARFQCSELLHYF